MDVSGPGVVTAADSWLAAGMDSLLFKPFMTVNFVR